MIYIKNFLDWFTLKPKLDNQLVKPPQFSEGQVWWCFCGENIGVEVSGKGKDYLRPFLIFTKLDKFSFVAIPLSTKIKVGSWYFQIKFKNIDQIIMLNQIKFFDYRRLNYKYGEITKQEHESVKKAIRLLLKI